MNCPSREVLRIYLEGEQFDLEPDVALHISSCSDCQQQLNKLSDDQQLAQWRDVSELAQTKLSDEAACQAVLQRLHASGSTDPSTDESSQSDTIRSDELNLEPALISGDFGRLGNYRIIRQLGQGGMAVVLEAIDTRLARTVAVKVLRPDRLTARERERFVREAQLLAKVKHEHVVDIYDVADPSEGPPYFVTELMHGSLRSLLKSAPLDARPAARLLAAVADGLHAAHVAGLVHRDIKPSNILLAQSADGREWTPKLSDFGLARALDTSILNTQTIGLSGTPAYMSPEQITTPGQVTIATDIYSLGVTLYEAICGELPFRGPAHAVLNQIVQEDAPWPHIFNPQVPRELELICMKAMSREVPQRYASAVEFAQDLRHWLAGRPIMAKPPGAIGIFTRWCRRNPRVATLSGAVLGLLIALTVGSLLATAMILASQKALQERTEAAEAATETAQAAEATASESARQAAHQRRITLDTLNELVGSVQSQLEKRPDTAQLRQALLTKAFEGLQSVTSSLESEEQVDRTMIDAHIKMASIKLEFSDRDSAIDQSSKAIALAEKAVQRLPNNVECLRDLANALTTQFDIYFSAFAHDKSLEIAKHIAEIRTRVCDQIPDDPNAARALLMIQQRVADLQWKSGKVSEAFESLTQLVTQLDALQTRAGKALDLRRDKCVLLNRIGTLQLQAGDTDRAAEMFTASRALMEELLQSDPDSILFRTDKAYVLGRLAMLKSSQGDHTQAIALATSTVELYRQLLATEPDRMQFHTLLGASYDQLYQMQLTGEDYIGGLESEKQSCEIASANCERDPSTARYPAMAAEAAQRVGDIFMRKGKMGEMVEWSTKGIELIKRAHSASDYVAEALKPFERSLELARDGGQLALKGESACREQLSSQPAVARYALALLAYIDATSGNVASAQTRVQELQAMPALAEANDQSELLLSIARTLALCHKRADDSQRAAFEPQALAALKASVTAQPQGKSFFARDPDQSSLRQLDAFKALLK